MSRRKQSNPRQIKRSLGDMEAKEEAQAADTSLPEREATVVEPEPTSPSSPDELEPLLQDGQRCVRARCSLTEGLSWGPFRGSIQTRASSPGQAELMRKLRQEGGHNTVTRTKEQR
uniref:Zinc finger protein ZFPM1/2 PR domain-containing protein n=1 Tax=Bos mutus grunniens TaxID=30521 RepID=A0A8B9YWZ6_BOSMU